MAFLTIADYGDQAKDYILNRITENDDTVRTSAELKAESEATSYLAIRYDVATDLAKQGENRCQALVMYLVDMSLYHMHSRINPGQVPQLRIDRYNEAKRWLEMVAAGKLKPDLTELTDADGNIEGNFIYGSNEKRSNRY